MASILVIDDDNGIQGAFATLLSGRGHQVTSALSGEAGLEVLDHKRPDLVLLDVWLPGMNGMDTLRAIRERESRMPVILMTGAGTMDLAIEASRMGAFDYRLKPFDPASMLASIDKALVAQRPSRVPDSKGEPGPHIADLIIGQTPPMHDLFRAIGRVAPTEAMVLIRGESGTGKELVARAIRQYSRRNEGPFVVLNCAAIPETLLESELFGYERGAFTGALSRKLGMFERAHGGTILLDEIGELPPGIQAKVLRVLQEKTFERIGGSETIRVDTRILAATNRDLELAMVEGRFREDLYHRLNVVTIHVPSLRERRGDIPDLVCAFLNRYARELGVERPAIDPSAMELLCVHGWPGNVRELEHCLSRVLIFTRGGTIQREDLLAALKRHSDGPSGAGESASEDQLLHAFIGQFLELHAGPGCEPRLMDMVERELIVEALRRTNGNQKRAAELLGIPRPTLHAKLQRHGVRTTTVVERN